MRPLPIHPLVPLLLVPLASCPSTAPGDLVRSLESCSLPGDQALHLKALGLLAVGRAEEALALWEGILDRNPSCARIGLGLRSALTLLDGPEREERGREFRGRFRKAYEARLREVSGREDGLLGNLAFTVALFEEEDRRRMKWLARALDRNPDHYYALTLAGETLWRLGKAETARESLRKALFLNNRIGEAWLWLALISEDLGLYATADRHYETYLCLTPAASRVKNNYARFLVHYRRKGRKAERVIRELLETEPWNLEYRLHQAAAFWIQERHAEAEGIYKELLRRNPREARILNNLGDLYLEELDMPVRALQVYRYMLSLPPSSDPYALFNQFLPVRVRVKRLLQELGDRAPPPPKGWEELLL